jgi:predicted AlkP superfamily phosphohydrolase/phosphomutase
MHTQLWDVLVMVFMQLDQAQHLFWHEMETHALQSGDVIPQLYQEADTLLGEVLDELEDDITLIIVSDHGAGPLRKAVSINQWLFKEGYLALKQTSPFQRLRQRTLLRMLTTLKMYLPPTVKTPLKARFGWVRDRAESSLVTSQIDWTTTRAFSLGEYGGIFINLQEREACGIVLLEDYEQLRSEIAGKLAGLKDPETGYPVIQRVYRREEIYTGPYVGQAPDLVLHWDYAYDCRERVGSEYHDIFEDEASYLAFADYKKTGVHHLQGVLLIYGPSVQPGIMEGTHLMDIAPTLLYLLGMPVPDDIDGHVLTKALKPSWLAQHPIAYQSVEFDTDASQNFGYSEDEEAQVKERLHALGYLD